MFFVFAIAMLTFSGWWFYKNTAEAGKNIEAKIGLAGAGVALFIALTTILAKMLSGMLRSSSINVYDAPFSYVFFAVCAGIVYAAGLGVRRILQNTPGEFLSDSKRSAGFAVTGTTDSEANPAITAAADNDMLDRVLRATAIVLLGAAGLAGGAKHWAGAADQLPFIIWFVTLPGLAVWFGRRRATLRHAIIQSAGFGAVFILPSFLFYWSRNFGENLFALALSLLIPAIVAAVAFSTRGPAITASSDENLRKTRADKIKIGSLIGILLPQFFQPAVFDEVRTFNAVSKELGDERIKQSVGMANVISCIFLALTAAVSVLAILAAVSDAL